MAGYSSPMARIVWKPPTPSPPPPRRPISNGLIAAVVALVATGAIIVIGSWNRPDVLEPDTVLAVNSLERLCPGEGRPALEDAIRSTYDRIRAAGFPAGVPRRRDELALAMQQLIRTTPTIGPGQCATVIRGFGEVAGQVR